MAFEFSTLFADSGAGKWVDRNTQSTQSIINQFDERNKNAQLFAQNDRRLDQGQQTLDQSAVVSAFDITDKKQGRQLETSRDAQTARNQDRTADLAERQFGADRLDTEFNKSNILFTQDLLLKQDAREGRAADRADKSLDITSALQFAQNDRAESVLQMTQQKHLIDLQTYAQSQEQYQAALQAQEQAEAAAKAGTDEYLLHLYKTDPNKAIEFEKSVAELQEKQLGNARTVLEIEDVQQQREHVAGLAKMDAVLRAVSGQPPEVAEKIFAQYEQETGIQLEGSTDDKIAMIAALRNRGTAAFTAAASLGGGSPKDQEALAQYSNGGIVYDSQGNVVYAPAPPKEFDKAVFEDIKESEKLVSEWQKSKALLASISDKRASSGGFFSSEEIDQHVIPLASTYEKISGIKFTEKERSDFQTKLSTDTTFRTQVLGAIDQQMKITSKYNAHAKDHYSTFGHFGGLDSRDEAVEKAQKKLQERRAKSQQVQR